MSARAMGLLFGFAADLMLGDPRRFHPVAGFGAVAAALERGLYADSRLRGAAHTAALVGAAIVVGVAAERDARHPAAQAGVTAVATWTVLGGRSLEREALAVNAHLTAGDLLAARRRLTHLVGRDTSALQESEVARAVVESVAENVSDAVVAPLVWGALGGVPGLLGYRAANTLDAMVGHHNDRYERFGWAAARFDDLVNLPGSRFAGAATLLASPRTARAAVRAWRRDAGAHPSPNAGVVEATFAGALGIRLGGTNRYYGSRLEHRAIMGDGRAVRPEDIVRAARLARRVGIIGAVVSASAALLAARRTAGRHAIASG
jgi:adenosylcobinamide-phosphate synthase